MINIEVFNLLSICIVMENLGEEWRFILELLFIGEKFLNNGGKCGYWVEI